MGLADELFETGRSHALTAGLLYRASLEEGHRRGVPDVDLFAFNGTHSLSLHYLLGLGLELMLKAAVVSWGAIEDEKFLRNEIGHDLVRALDEAEKVGFQSAAPHLREILQVLREPYKAHWFRYGKPAEFSLPSDFTQVIESLDTLDGELRARFWPNEPAS